MLSKQRSVGTQACSADRSHSDPAHCPQDTAHSALERKSGRREMKLCDDTERGGREWGDAEGCWPSPGARWRGRTLSCGPQSQHSLRAPCSGTSSSPNFEHVNLKSDVGSSGSESVDPYKLSAAVNALKGRCFGYFFSSC